MRDRIRHWYRRTRIAWRRWRQLRALDFAAWVYRVAKRMESWAEPRLRQGKPEVIYPIGIDRYSRM